MFYNIYFLILLYKFSKIWVVFYNLVNFLQVTTI